MRIIKNLRFSRNRRREVAGRCFRRGCHPQVVKESQKIRDDDGLWQQVEAYLSEHTDSTLTHGICPECEELHFPEEASDHGPGELKPKH